MASIAFPILRILNRERFLSYLTPKNAARNLGFLEWKVEGVLLIVCFFVALPQSGAYSSPKGIILI
jgi:hypothetical protein